MLIYTSQDRFIFILLIFTIQICSSNGMQYLTGHIDTTNKKHLSLTKLLYFSIDPIDAICLGGLFIFCAFCMLWYNERRQAITEWRIGQAKKECTTVNSAEINSNTNNRLIHINGNSHTNQLIIDDIFGLVIRDCVKLTRSVEMFQWVRTQTNEDNRNSNYYEQKWSPFFQNNTEAEFFNDESKWIIKAEDKINQNVYVGANLLTKSLAEQVKAKEIINLNFQNAQNVAKYLIICKSYQNHISDALGQEMYFYQEKGRLTNNDLRVTFRAARTGPTTVISQQQNNTFIPYSFHDQFEQTLHQDFQGTENNTFFSVIIMCCCCCCYCFYGFCQLCKFIEKPLLELNLLYQSILTQQQVFSKLTGESDDFNLCSRITGYILMGLGFYLIFYPVTWVVSYVPLLGDLLATLTGFSFFVVSFLISIPFSILTIAFAWLFYHPKYGIALIGLSGLIGTAIYFYLKSQQ